MRPLRRSPSVAAATAVEAADFMVAAVAARFVVAAGVSVEEAIAAVPVGIEEAATAEVPPRDRRWAAADTDTDGREDTPAPMAAAMAHEDTETAREDTRTEVGVTGRVG